jgi:hypothetical protein
MNANPFSNAPSAEASMNFSEWLESKTNTSRLEACELVLARFRAMADTNPEFTSEVGGALWKLLSTSPGSDAATILDEMRGRAGALGRDHLDHLSSKLMHATASKGEIESEAGKLVSSWFKAIALCSGAAANNGRALHVARAYEKTFACLGRLMNQTSGTQSAEDERAAA